tara:strand:- start:125 stop:232 length:108 start_codon:yes stop_codon:yes gene_type:complete
VAMEQQEQQILVVAVEVLKEVLLALVEQVAQEESY